ncbi:MAG TPA: hydroxymyristoyl-ACP dehydratase [Rhodanobacteraceae bacterium]|nr:hydroxymyristoyl-ACP dehydratase [Rhodanobacteraceae bacterium]
MNDQDDSFRTAFRIDPGHPALAGHFPDNPVVPGVVLLERVARALQTWRRVGMQKLDVKFVRPLLPGEDAVIELRAHDGCTHFTVALADGGMLARGKLETAREWT